MDVDTQKMEKVGITQQHGILKLLIAVFALLFSFSCANKILKIKDPETLEKNEEFEKTVKIEEVPVVPVVSDKSGTENTESSNESKPRIKKIKKTKKDSAGKLKRTVVDEVKTQRRQPELESDVGFQGRRPIKDPFRIGETVKHKVKYFKMSAGDLTLQVKPLVNVNGVKSYQFMTAIKTSSFFESFYSVDDYVVTLVDFENLVPNAFTLHVKETGQVKEARSFFDHVNNKATYWQKKVTEKNGVEEKKIEWEILPYAQNVFSAVFYMRNFQWDVGVENAFVVADDEKNLVFKAKGIRKEVLSTDAGEFQTIVIKPEITLKDKFQPVGDIFIWLSDDDRKFILRIEAKIKIGTLVSEVYELNKGAP